MSPIAPGVTGGAFCWCRGEARSGAEVVVKTDERGRTIDIHALRHTFGTHLPKAGAPPRTAQAAMRHSDPSLTANVYTDPKLLDVAGAVASPPDLPNLPLAAAGESAVARAAPRIGVLSPVTPCTTTCTRACTSERPPRSFPGIVRPSAPIRPPPPASPELAESAGPT